MTDDPGVAASSSTVQIRSPEPQEQSHEEEGFSRRNLRGFGAGKIRKALAEGWTPPVAKLIGFRLTKIERGTAAIELQASREHENPMGTLHGGIICDIADAAMGMSYASLLRADESFTTVELKVNFLRPFWSGRLVARGKVIKKGRHMGLARVPGDG